MPTIQVDIKPHPDGSCQNCDLLIFDDTGAPPYCAGGHPLQDPAKGYPKRPESCRRNEISLTDTMEQLRAKQALSVMPLIGPLLDAWDDLPGDVRYGEDLLGFADHMEKLVTLVEGQTDDD